MENASKALIIAGSILLSILIIALGMYIFSTSSSTTDVSVLSETEIQTFNAKFDKYTGKQSGSNVNALIKTLIANASANKGADEKLPAVKTSNFDLKPQLEVKGAKDAKAKIDNYISGLNDVSTKLEKSHTYNVTVGYNGAGLINNITIDYNT